MYKDSAGTIIYSPSDLIRFLESPFASWMERHHLECPEDPDARPDPVTEEQELVFRLGDEHEARHLARLASGGADVASIPKEGVDRAEAERLTGEAMAAGREVIYQARLAHGGFAGMADFLERVGPAGGGPHHYEVTDTKLALSVKPYYLIQLCCYAEMLAHAQRAWPARIHVVLGDGGRETFRTIDFSYYYMRVKGAFLEQMAGYDGRNRPEPEPRADHGRWASHAEAWLREKDHPVLVAGITRGQIRRLADAGVGTVADLAHVGGRQIDGMAPEVLERLADQAQLQVATRERQAAAGPGEVVPPEFRVLVPGGDGRPAGLALLPPPSPMDVAFDMEGYPFVEGGLEYLFGVIGADPAGEARFFDWWAHDREGERDAFGGFIDWAFARWKADPAMHIYHYAPYETTALKRLMGRHGTREEEVDTLLRHGVFVDLYQIVRRGLRVGAESYSIKKIEALYMPPRAGDVTGAVESVVYYARWRQSGQGRDPEGSAILRQIRDYNMADCVSTWRLIGWLRERQGEAGIAYMPKVADEDQAPRALPEPLQRQIALSRQILAEGGDAATRPLWEMLAHLTCFHYRELKPAYWRRFEREAMDDDELRDDPACVGGARLESEAPRAIKKSLGFAYRFDPDQDTKIGEGDHVVFSHDRRCQFEVAAFDPDGRLVLKISERSLAKMGGSPPADGSLIPWETPRADKLADSIEAVARGWAEHRAVPRAVRQFLLREPPRVAGHAAGAPQLAPGEIPADGALRIVRGLDSAALCVQGPPGSGKSTLAARVIAALLREGRNIGITSNSHKAQLNLLRMVARERGAAFACIKAGGNADDPLFDEFPMSRHMDNTQAAASYVDGLIAGTAWVFCRPEMAGKLDHLFVDEAGQVSVANLIAMSPAARNLVLLGDQMQLEQPIQGTHPGESGLSALSYFLRDHATVPGHLGLFLDRSHRMHPDLCGVISEMVYEGRLESTPAAEQRRLIVPDQAEHLTRPTGILFSPVEHEGNTQASDQEVGRIRAIVGELLHCWLETGGQMRRLTLEDILFVAPYNMQVRRLQAAFPGARVGSVDRFQGQEAPVVILSMCSSFGEYGSRGLAFLLDKNRLNVALSRAQVLAIVVGDPRIAATPCGTVADMGRVNLFCRLVGGSGKRGGPLVLSSRCCGLAE